MINSNWLIFYDVSFYVGLVFCIVGFSIWWIMILGLVVMIASRIEEKRIKEIIEKQ